MYTVLTKSNKNNIGSNKSINRNGNTKADCSHTDTVIYRRLRDQRSTRTKTKLLIHSIIVVVTRCCITLSPRNKIVNQ